MTHAKHDEPQGRTGYETAKAKAGHALTTSRESASDAARKTAAGIEANPLGVVVGGLALGAIAGALIPRSAREKELLAPVGKRLAGAAVLAIGAAKEAGFAELDQRGLTRDAARDQFKTLFQGVGQALSSAGSAAAHTATAKSEG